MSLTTPVTNDMDIAFPGENWFFYWKTSASLWEEKLNTYTNAGKIIVPINWSFHSDTGDQIDFGALRPETDLKRLIDVIVKNGREPVIYLPISPAPYLTNGGLPSLLARTLAIGENEMVRAVIDNSETINKIFSFYDPRIFKAFSKFTKALGAFISESGIACDVWGVDCGYMHGGYFERYLDDSSRAFESAFTRFLEAKKAEDDSLNEQMLSPELEWQLKNEFMATIDELYIDIASKGIGPNWEGLQRICFLGGNQQDFFNRITGTGSTSYYSSQLIQSIEREIIPSSVLLDSLEKKHLLKRQFKELVMDSFVPFLLSGKSIGEENNRFSPLTFFNFSSVAAWERLGVYSFIYENYRHCYNLKEGSRDFFNSESDLDNGVSFILGEELIESTFAKVLKHFLCGGKIVLERSALSEDLSRRLESFILENSLEVEQVNLNSVNVANISLGEGRLVLFDQTPLKSFKLEKLFSFWHSILETFEIGHINVNASDGVEFLWRKREATSGELNFEEVRRLSLYNTSSYKRKVKLSFEKNFALSKVIDEVNVTVSPKPHSCEIEMLPEGAVSFDFGVFTV